MSGMTEFKPMRRVCLWPGGAVLWLSAILAIGAVFSAMPVSAAHLKLKHEKFAATSERSDWCRSVVKLRVDSPHPETVFNPPDSVFLQSELLGKVRAVASFTCPNITKIVFTGWSGNLLYYAGAASKEDGWRLVGLFAPPE